MHFRDLFELISYIFLIVIVFNCGDSDFKKTESIAYHDTAFFQEFHQGYEIAATPDANKVRKIVVDKSYNVWIATAAGIFVKPVDKPVWNPVIDGVARGPAFTVMVDTQSVVWMGTWDGVYSFRQGHLQKHQSIDCPVSVICQAREGIYFLGPQGIWLETGEECQKLDYPIAKSVRDAVSDGQGGLWIATKAGLYHYQTSGTYLYQDEKELISCYLTGLALSADGRLWVGV